MAIDQTNFQRYKAIADQAATANGIPPQIFENLVGVETGGTWDPYSVGTSGEIGLTQLMPNVVNAYGINAWDPAANLQAGAKYLAKIFSDLGTGATWAAALSAYNSGTPTSDVGKAYAAQVLAGVNLAGNVVGSPVSTADQNSGLGGLPGQASNAATGIAGVLAAIGNALAPLDLTPGAPNTGAPNIVERLMGVGSGQSTDATEAAAAAASSPGNLAKYAIAFLVIGTTVIIGFTMLARPPLRAAASFIPKRG